MSWFYDTDPRQMTYICYHLFVSHKTKYIVTQLHETSSFLRTSYPIPQSYTISIGSILDEYWVSDQMTAFILAHHPFYRASKAPFDPRHWFTPTLILFQLDLVKKVEAPISWVNIHLLGNTNESIILFDIYNHYYYFNTSLYCCCQAL